MLICCSGGILKDYTQRTASKTNGWNVGDHDELVVGRDRIERTHGVEQMQRVIYEERNVQ